MTSQVILAHPRTRTFMTFGNEGCSEVGLSELEEQRVELETLRSAVE